MAHAAAQALVFCVIGVFVSNVASLQRDQLFPYGLGFDQNLDNDSEDARSAELVLSVPLVFYDQHYNSIFINENGLVSLTTEVPAFFNVPFPLDYPVIAPFYSDVDIRSRGAIWFRESQNAADIKKSAGMIRNHFSAARLFEAKRVIVVTWDDVGSYDRGNNTGNTFQLALATDGEDTFALFLYPEDGIQWIQGSGKTSSLPDALAQGGFVSEDGRFQVIQGSGTDQFFNVGKWSNVDTPGLWLFNIGKLSPLENVQFPDGAVKDALGELEKATSCSQGSSLCHSKAVCVDINPGFCCKCSAGFYGNGRSCLPQGTPQRISGKVNGKVNGIAIRDEDLHSYISTTDGRAFTALSRVPDSLGFDLQPLSVLGTVIGWVFARSVANATNGFQLTGGILNYTAQVDFPQTGHSLTVTHRFVGADVFSYMRLEVFVNGSVPGVPHGAKIEIPDYEEEYSFFAPGEIRSRGQRVYRIDGSTLDIPYTVEQRIIYSTCAASRDQLSTLRLKVGRNFVTYDPKEQIVRYAMTSTVLTLEASEDPCLKGRQSCGPNSGCVVQGESFKCVCNKGFEASYERGARGERASCVDINECDIGLDHCSENAICINEPGSYSCRCKDGFQGDGFNCQRISACSRVRCGVNARCVENEIGDAQCRCLDGFQGDGFVCVPGLPTPDCRQVNLCDVNALCKYRSESDTYGCVCQPGYKGDGVVCTPESESCEVAANCDPFASCIYDDAVSGYVCRCLPGFEGDGYQCSAIRESANVADVVKPKCVLDICWCDEGYQYQNGRCEFKEQTSCKDDDRCHRDAECVFSPSAQEYVCQCRTGFHGNGLQCSLQEEATSEVTCDQEDLCAPDATCIFNDYSLKSECVCNTGFRGDGYVCTPIDGCNSLLDCDENAQCLFDASQGRFQCRCNEGYAGDGKSCAALRVPDAEPAELTCEVLVNCHANADCVYDEEFNRYQCRCRLGYAGDGQHCQAAQIGCNIINNCDRNADCHYDILSIGYRCKCKEGFAGDGQFCRPAKQCSEDPSVCSTNAKCAWNNNGGYHCQCKEGFIGDGFECKALSKHEGNFLLVTQGMSVLKVPIEPSATQSGQLVHIGIFQSAVGIDIDCIQGRAYWADITGKAIRSNKYGGGDHRVFVSDDIESPEGVAIDWASRNIYWTDSGKDTIEVANLDTKVRRVLFNTSLVNPRGIAVHPSRGLLFWSDWNREGPKIERSNTDGSGRTVIIKDGIALPNSLSVDLEHEELCWADAGTRRIECADIDGRNRRTVRADVKYPFGLAQLDGLLYWTDWEDNLIRGASKTSNVVSRKLPVPPGGQGKLYGIVAVPQFCPSVWSPCQEQSGGCSANELCLPNGRGGRTCLQ